MAVFLIAGLVFGAATHGQVGLGEAIGILVDSGRAGRSLYSYTFELTVAGVSSYAAAMAFLAVAARLERRQIRSFLSVAPTFRWRQVGLGLVIFLPVISLAIWVASLTSPAPLSPLFAPGEPLAARVAYVGAAAFFLYLAALSEEMLFRGWALQQTGVFTRRLPVILLVNGALFSLAHFDPDPAAFLSRAIMGMGWTWIVLRLGGVELTTGAHLANNLAICLFVKPILFVTPKREPFEVASVALEAATVVLLVLAVEGVLRRWPILAANGTGNEGDR
jgi:membrane protease YdiL (CAAX protease family)